MNERAWLIAYDVTEVRRLGRIHRFLKEHSLPLQYSVFSATLSDVQLDRLLAGIATVIDPRADDVRVYPLPASDGVRTIGRPWIAEGLVIAKPF